MQEVPQKGVENHDLRQTYTIWTIFLNKLIATPTVFNEKKNYTKKTEFSSTTICL